MERKQIFAYDKERGNRRPISIFYFYFDPAQFRFLGDVSFSSRWFLGTNIGFNFKFLNHGVA